MKDEEKDLDQQSEEIEEEVANLETEEEDTDFRAMCQVLFYTARVSHEARLSGVDKDPEVGKWLRHMQGVRDHLHWLIERRLGIKVELNFTDAGTDKNGKE